MNYTLNEGWALRWVGALKGGKARWGASIRCAQSQSATPVAAPGSSLIDLWFRRRKDRFFLSKSRETQFWWRGVTSQPQLYQVFAVAPGCLHGNLHFARQFFHSNDNLTMKNGKIGKAKMITFLQWYSRDYKTVFKCEIRKEPATYLKNFLHFCCAKVLVQLPCIRNEL